MAPAPNCAPTCGPMPGQAGILTLEPPDRLQGLWHWRVHRKSNRDVCCRAPQPNWATPVRIGMRTDAGTEDCPDNLAEMCVPQYVCRLSRFTIESVFQQCEPTPKRAPADRWRLIVAPRGATKIEPICVCVCRRSQCASSDECSSLRTDTWIVRQVDSGTVGCTDIRTDTCVYRGSHGTS